MRPTAGRFQEGLRLNKNLLQGAQKPRTPYTADRPFVPETSQLARRRAFSDQLGMGELAKMRPEGLSVR